MGAPELWLELVEQVDHGSSHRLVVGRLVRRPPALGVVRREVVVEVERVAGTRGRSRWLLPQVGVQAHLPEHHPPVALEVEGPERPVGRPPRTTSRARPASSVASIHTIARSNPSPRRWSTAAASSRDPCPARRCAGETTNVRTSASTAGSVSSSPAGPSAAGRRARGRRAPPAPGAAATAGTPPTRATSRRAPRGRRRAMRRSHGGARRRRRRPAAVCRAASVGASAAPAGRTLTSAMTPTLPAPARRGAARRRNRGGRGRGTTAFRQPSTRDPEEPGSARPARPARPFAPALAGHVPSQPADAPRVRRPVPQRRDRRAGPRQRRRRRRRVRRARLDPGRADPRERRRRRTRSPRA